MSELKAISGKEIREDIDYNTRGIDPENKEWRNYGKELCDTLYYRKSEADKVIAELEGRIADGDRDFELANHQNEMLLKIVRHRKYKQCVAMAEWCNGEMGRETFACFRPRGTKELWREEHNYWAKWRKIWFELAQKFKESV